MSFENFEKETKKAESLVERMVRFARLKGLHLEEKPFSISLVTIDGTSLTLYKNTWTLELWRQDRGGLRPNLQKSRELEVYHRTSRRVYL